MIQQILKESIIMTSRLYVIVIERRFDVSNGCIANGCMTVIERCVDVANGCIGRYRTSRWRR